MIKEFILVLFFVGGCWGTTMAHEVRRAIPAAYSLDQTAQLLAGISSDPNNEMHDHAMKRAWSDYMNERGLPMQQWALQEMSMRIPAPRVVRYLFSGPDILSVLNFFPESPLYILCAREPIGTITPLEKLSPEDLSTGLTELREKTNTFLEYGYFITKEMKQQFTHGPFQGVLPVLLTFLALSNNEILSADHLVLSGSPALRILFKRRSSDIVQQLLYVQADLSNEGNASFWKWLHSFGPGAAYLKAASYLLHEENFSHARRYLLSDSETILQDDSGIPLRFFEPSLWTLYFFGDYKQPLAIFKKYYQADLFSMYAASPLHAPMPFGTGYQVNAGESGGANLLLAVRHSFTPKAMPIGKN